MKLFKSHSRLNIHSNFFTQRVIGSWNSLPDKANSVGVFKAKLDKYWLLKGYGYEQRLTAYYKYLLFCLYIHTLIIKIIIIIISQIHNNLMYVSMHGLQLPLSHACWGTSNCYEFSLVAEYSV